ncbi:MAG: hypothetical protein UFA98_01055 [Ruminococcus sp.]|nr:hypothetical protein [Ruminococcus sp.]
MKNKLTPAAAIIELNRLKDNSVVSDADRRNAAVNIAIKAINHCLIKRKPNSFYTDNQYGEFYQEFFCPNCDRLVATNFCQHCGQALDWSGHR